MRDVHDLTQGTPFAAGSEVAAHRNLSQPNFIFRDMVPIAIIDWDVTDPGTGARIWASSSGLSSIPPSTAKASLRLGC